MNNVIFAFVSGFLLIASTARAQFDYTTNADNTLTIVDYYGTNFDLTIPSTINGQLVTAIAESALSSDILVSVEIPASVTNIDPNTFNYCPNLIAITVDAQNPSYSSPGNVLFDRLQTVLIQYPAALLGNYSIPGTVTNIGTAAFPGCFGLTGLTIPGSVSNIEVNCFDSCYGLTNVIILDGIASIGESAFLNCVALLNVTIPNSVTNIGESAFEDCDDLSTIKIPFGVTCIHESSFLYCYNLSCVTLPSSIGSIQTGAFELCTNLTNIVIPASVTNIEPDSFTDCVTLSNVYFAGNAPPITAPFIFGSGYTYYSVTFYYLPGTTGWDAFSPNPAWPVVLWNPFIQTGDGNFGVRGDQFGFDITGTADISIVVEACTNLSIPTWIPLQSLTLTNGLFYFGDPQWTNYSARYYRISSP
jgi:hypothetical protein